MNAKPQIYSNATDKTVIRIMPKLAAEIGLNESIVLLQISFWIGVYNNHYDGQWWVYMSTRDMVKNAFPFWSPATVNRAINSLIDKNLIHSTDKYNKKAYDTTRWFSLNIDEIARLKSVVIVLETTDNATLFQNETPPSQNDTRSNQNETTIPESTTESISKEVKSSESDIPDTQETDKTDDQTKPKELDKLDNDFKEKIALVRDAGIVTTSDYEKFKVDADDHPLDRWRRGVEITKERRAKDGRYKNYRYLLTIMSDLEAEDKQAALVQAAKPVVPYHQDAPVDNTPAMSDAEAQQALQEIRAQLKERGVKFKALVDDDTPDTDTQKDDAA